MKRKLLLLLMGFITTSYSYGQYCSASGGGAEYISGVEIGTISNTGTTADGYHDYTALSTDLYIGQSGVSITITNGNSYPSDDVGVWIDWNQDSDFDDADENVVCKSDNGGQGTFTFDVSAGATLGNTVMRVRIKYNGSDCGSPCGTTTNGEVEDYTINVTTPPSCPAPSNQTESNITTNSADLGWTENGSASTWDIEIVPAGASPTGTPTATGVTSNPYTYGSLYTYATYDWYVRADCGSGSTSTWTGPSTFTTACAAVSTLSEDFANPSTPYCWTNDGNESWLFSTGAGFGASSAGDHTPGGGTNYAWIDGSGGVGTNVLLTPFIDLSGFTTPAFEFYYFSDNTNNSGDDNTLTVDFWDGAAWNTLLNYSGDNPFWQQGLYDLSGYTITGDVRFRFVVTETSSDSYYNDILVDDVTVLEYSGCSAPTAQTESNITTSSADLDWTESGTATTWNIEWGSTGFAQGNGTMVSGVTANPYSLSGLTASTSYDWYVQADCGGSSSSTWTGPHMFQTLCDASIVPYFEDFDAVTAPGFPGCMTVENTNGDSKEWITATGGLSSPNSAKISYNSSAAMNDWFFTRGLQLTDGVTYEVEFAYRAASVSNPEKLAVDWGNAASSTAMSGTPIFDNNSVSNIDWNIGSGTFTPLASGTYYVGFHGYSDANEFYLYVDDIQVAEQQTATTWNGGVSSEWDEPGNWSSGVPTSNTDITIPTTATNYPTLSHAHLCNTITIESDNTGDASILNDGLLVVSGDATIQRYLTAGVWHDFSPSAANQIFNAMYFNHSPDVWLTQFNEPDNSRTYHTVLTDTMPSGSGYEIWVGGSNAVTVNFNGTMNRGDVALSSASTPPLSYSGADPLGYNLIGNPFASPLALDSGSWNMANVDSTFWVWDDATYKDYNTTTKTGSMTGGIIPMGQGFFIHANSTSPTITIPIEARVHSGQAYYKNTNAAGSSMEVMSLRATYNTGKYDELNIAFLNGAKDEFENNDTRKMFAFYGEAPQVYAIIPDEEVSLNSLPVLAPGEDKTVEVGYKAGTNGQQTLVADVSQLEDIDVVLEDLKTNTIQNLNDNPVYKFDATTYQDPDRFKIHFNRSVTGIANNEASTTIRAYSYNKTLYIVSKGDMVNQTKHLDVYDILGRKILSKKLPGGDVISVPVTVSDAYVVVHIISSGEVNTTKVFIK